MGLPPWYFSKHFHSWHFYRLEEKSETVATAGGG